MSGEGVAQPPIRLAATLPDAAAAAPNLLDVAIPYRRDLIWISLLFGVTAGIGTPIGVGLGFSPIAAAVVFVPVAMALHVALERRNARKVRILVTAMEQRVSAGVESLRSDSFCEPLRVCARVSSNTVVSFRYSPMRWVAAARARHGLAGRAVRIADKLDDLPALGPPLAMPFEPTPLTERSELVMSVNEAAPTQGELLRERMRTAMRTFGRSRVARWFFIGSLLMGGIALLGTLLTTARDLLQGRQPVALRSMFIGLAAGAPIALLAVVVAGWRQERWFVVPGAILVRRSSWWSQRSEISMLRREESVLMHWLDANQLAIAAADGRISSTAATARMAELAIRAWLSPLPPPPIERLSDLGVPAAKPSGGGSALANR
jgi:hypothetical protein